MKRENKRIKNHRNRCPNCLCSLHVDEEPGDRAFPIYFEKNCIRY